MATITALLVIYSSLMNLNNPKLLTTLTGRTEAHLYGPRDCSAHVRSRWLFDRTTAVSPKHAGPFHLRMRLQRRRFASDAQPTCRSAGFAFHGRRTRSHLVPSYLIVFSFDELRLDLGRCLV
jgi:hypothetical protein